MLHAHRFRHAVQKEQRAEAEADQNPLRQVAEHHQQERHQKHERIAPRGAQQGGELMLLRHIPRHHGQNGGKG